MRILRWIGTRLLAASLGVVLALLSICAIVSATVLNTGFMKTAIKNSGFYDNFVSSSLKLAAASLDDQDANMAQLIADMTPTVEQVITPSFLQTNFELVIDGTGDWLSGKTAQPQFAIDTQSVKNNLDDALATYLSQRLSTLPVCTTYNSGLSPDDVITTACQPPIAISENEILTAASSFTQEIPMLAEPELNADTLLKDISDGTWQTVPNAYKWTRLSPYLFALIAVVLAGVIILISHDRIKAIRRIGHIILANSLILIIAGAVITIYFGHNDISFISSDSAGQAEFIQEIVVPGIQSIFSTFGTWLLYFGVGYALLSAICYVVAHWLKIRQSKPPKPHAETDQKPVAKDTAEPHTKTEGEDKEKPSEPKISTPPEQKTSHEQN